MDIVIDDDGKTPMDKDLESDEAAVSPLYEPWCAIDDDGKTPMDKDFESDEAVWALYERWCKAFKKQREYATMPRWLAGSRYSNIMHNMCTTGTLTFLKIQRKQPFTLRKEC